MKEPTRLYRWRPRYASQIDSTAYAHFWRYGRATAGEPSIVFRAIRCPSYAKACRLAFPNLYSTKED